MKKTMMILFCAIIISIFFISMINAEIEYYQTKSFRGNGTIENRLTLSYGRGIFGIANDFVLAEDPFETYVQYDMYPQKFNSENPNHQVDYCELKIQVWRDLESSPVILLDQNYTDQDPDIFQKQYFFQLHSNDQAIVVETCHFKDKSFHELLLPAEMVIVEPTTECKSCQYYLWTTQEKDITKTQIIGNNVVTISDYIQKLISLIFEVILVLFWIFLILMIFVAIGLIFVGIYWLYIYLSRLSK